MYNMANSNSWKNDEACLLKTMQLWLERHVHAINPSVYKEKKPMDQVVPVKMTVQLGRTFTDVMDYHNLTDVSLGMEER